MPDEAYTKVCPQFVSSLLPTLLTYQFPAVLVLFLVHQQDGLLGGKISYADGRSAGLEAISLMAFLRKENAYLILTRKIITKKEGRGGTFMTDASMLLLNNGVIRIAALL